MDRLMVEVEANFFAVVLKATMAGNVLSSISGHGLLGVGQKEICLMEIESVYMILVIVQR